MDLKMQSFDEKMINTLVAIEQYIIAFFTSCPPKKEFSSEGSKRKIGHSTV